MDDTRRIAIVETKTIDLTDGGTGVAQWRFQIENQLNSAVFELDDTFNVISYEEYHPFGDTSFHTATGAAEVSAKRYRYTGKERDEETGLYYYGARYLAAWLGRWTAADPAGMVDGPNVYSYVKNSPIVMRDPDGLWSWGKTLGFIGAVVIGVAVTALTAGAAGPIAAGIIGGFAAGAGGELIEAGVDKRPTSVGRVLLSGAIGAALGGVFSGVGQILARTGLGAAIAENIGRSAIGQAASRALYKIATSPSAPAVAARTVASGVRQGITVLEKAGEAAGRGLGGRFAQNAAGQAALREGLESATNQAAEATAARAAAAGRPAGKEGVAATIQGEVNGQSINATTFPGRDPSGTG
jgi:RHS repeat-associated protein